MQAVVDQLNAFLSALALPAGGILSLIIGLAQIIFSTIAGFMNNLPTAVKLKLSHLEVAGVHVDVVAKERTRRAFKKDFNRELDHAKKAGVGIPHAAYLHVGLFERL